jgi:DNA polymerase-3 subunit gamma/tau
MSDDFTAKYRPQKVEELDLISIQEGLTKVLKSGKIPHAFLFAGPRGTGKTSAARIIAKAVNCLEQTTNLPVDKTGNKGKRVHPESSPRGEPCNQCHQCLSITGGANIDVLEIDAASNRGIDDIRELREKIKLAPAKAQYKVYIIDEVHMLTTEAFNALLKTLEEPPPHAIFILCTTAPEKLPETIISRCLRFNFKRPTIKEIVAKLEKIAKEEKLKVEKQALLEIARGVDGSFRDANKILEQASFESREINLETVKEILGQAVGFDPKKLIGFLANRETKEAIGEINRLTESGANLRFYLEQLLEELRGLLLRQYGIEVDGQELAEFNLEKMEIETLIRLFSRAAIQLKEAVIPQLPLELAVVEWGEGLGAGEPALRESARPAGSTPSSSGLPQTDEDFAESSPPLRLKKGKKSNFSLEEIQSRWQEVLTCVRPRNHSVEALLRATRPKAIDGQVLTVEVFYKFHKDKLETEKCRKLVEEAACEVYQGLVKIKFLLGEKPRTTGLPAGKAGATEKKTDYTEKSVKPAPKPVPTTGPGNGETTDRDIIEVAKEIFSGTVE